MLNAVLQKSGSVFHVIHALAVRAAAHHREFAACYLAQQVIHVAAVLLAEYHRGADNHGAVLRSACKPPAVHAFRKVLGASVIVKVCNRAAFVRAGGRKAVHSDGARKHYCADAERGAGITHMARAFHVHFVIERFGRYIVPVFRSKVDDGIASADRVNQCLHGLDTLPPDSAAHRSVPDNGFLITVPDLETAAEIANRKAPEHLELAMNPGPARDKLAASLRNYGSLFTGHRSAEVLGDYAAGLNHTLPTAGAAAFTGGLSVRHFLKTVTTLRAGETPDADLSGWEASARAAETLAEAEGLTGHRTAAALRLRSR